MKKLIAFVLAAVLVCCLVGCTAAPAAEKPAAETKTEEKTEEPAVAAAGETFKIGVVLPMTGGSARMGELQYEGFKLFQEWFNEEGGIKSLDGMQIELILADSTGDPATGASEAERLINNEGVQALVGPYNSSVGATMQPIAEKYGIPFCVTNCTADNVMQSDGELKYTFRPNHSNSSNVQSILNCIDFLKTKDSSVDLSSFAIIYENTDWGVSCVDTYAAALQNAGYEMKICESFESGSADFSTIVNKIKSAGVGFIMPCMYVSDAVLFMNQYNEYGLENALIWAGGGILVDDFVTSVGDLAENQISMNGWCLDTMADSTNPELANLINERCIRDTGGNMNENVANGWIGIATLMEAVEAAASTDADAIVDKLATLKLDRSSVALLFHAYDGVDMTEEVLTWDGASTMQHQNKYAACIMTQIIDGEYRQIYPDWSKNPVVWPVK